LHSAESQICNLRGVRHFGARCDAARPADYKSAIQQIENLRYWRWRHLEIVPQMHEADRW
jgi:hypothetical protein